MLVTVAYAAPGIESLVHVELEAGSCVADAVAKCGIVAHFALDPAHLEFAIFGQRVRGNTPLRTGDRVELTRPLTADAGFIRRARAEERAAAPGPKGKSRS